MMKASITQAEKLELARQLDDAITDLEEAGTAEQAAFHVACEQLGIDADEGQELLVFLAAYNRHEASMASK